MTLRAGFIEARHRQSARRFHDVHAVGVMALHAVHFPSSTGDAAESEGRLRLEMALETGLGVLARIDDELPAAPPAATCLLAGPWHDSQPFWPDILETSSATARAGWRERRGRFRVTLEARLVADERRAFIAAGRPPRDPLSNRNNQ